MRDGTNGEGAMEMKLVDLCMGLLRIMLAFMGTALLYYAMGYVRAGNFKEDCQGVSEFAAEKMRQSRRRGIHYETVGKFMNSTGIIGAFGGGITPFHYIGFKGAMALFWAFLGMRLHILCAVPFGILGFRVPDVIAARSNHRDNENMMEDIKNLYDILYIQTRSGEHITTVLSDSYLYVKNKRLKRGLQEMSSMISGRHDIEEAILKFQAKFENDYINALVISILQSLKTGRSSQMFEDMSRQIEGIDRAIVIREKQNIQNTVLLFQVLVYLAIIVTVVYLTVLGASKALNFQTGG